MFESLRLWWQARTGEEETPFDGDTPAWVVSLVFHLGLLIILTLILRELPQEERGHVELVTSVIEEDLTTPEEFFFSHLDKVEIGANSIEGVDMAEAFAEIEQDVTELDTPQEQIEDVKVEIGELAVDSMLSVNMAVEGNPDMLVQGAVGSGTTGSAGALDRITQEIIDSLDQRKTLVAWIFDKSVSLSKQRAAINDRLDRIYEELNVIEATGDQRFTKHDDLPLLSSVIAFGSTVDFMTPKPTDQLSEIKAAISAIQNDETGVERVFEAVHKAAEQYKSYATARDRRNVMLVVFTDEAGDDGVEMLDRTVGLCRRYVMPVYVVGVPSPFGRKKVEVKWIDPDPQYDQTPQWTEVTQGPESMYPERVMLAFSSTNPREEPLDSGFGPFHLTRLSVETSGIYFSVHPNRVLNRPVTKAETSHLSGYIKHFFDPEVMRRYRPDYVSFDEYKVLMQKNGAKRALVNTSLMSLNSKIDPFEDPRLVFQKRDEASLANMLSESQQKAAKFLAGPITTLLGEIAKGEPDREKLIRPRWQAGYDLAMGRILAAKVRAEGYNNMLAMAKNGMKFKDEKSDTWILKPSDAALPNSALQKQAEKARAYLQRVVDDHPNTPWAMLAKMELDDSIGWEWSEEFRNVNRPRDAGGGGNNNRPRPRDDNKRMIAKPKPKRAPPRI